MNGRYIEFAVSECESGMNIGDLLRSKGFSARRIARLKRTENGISADGCHARTTDTIKTGTVISLFIAEEGKTPEPSPGLLKLAPVRYEDDDVIVFAKPAGMPVHTSAKHRDDTLENVFACVCGGMAFRPVNRLDRDTSGLAAAAKNAFAAASLQKSLTKTYFAAAEGHIFGNGRIYLPIAREQESIITRCVREDGKPAETTYSVIKRGYSADGAPHTLLACRLGTGRTHQIRVHFSHLGHPLAGDDMYGGSMKNIGTQALHCGEISFADPVSGRIITLTEPLPDEINNLFAKE